MASSPSPNFADRFREPFKPCILGQGSFGQVTEALDTVTGHLVAIKSILLVDDAISKLISEISLMKRLSHPNIVKYLGASRTDHQLKIYMEYIAGGSLAKLISHYGNLPESLVKIYARDMLMGLNYLHGSRIAHRDIKCENLLLSCQGVVKVSDFGTSKQTEEFTQTFTGTPFFMAPEVCLGEAYDPFLADMWSVGITVAQMIDGQAPFSNDARFKNPLQFLTQLAAGTIFPGVPPHASPECQDFLHRCLQRDPKMRSLTDALLSHPFLSDVTLVAPAPPSSGGGGLHFSPRLIGVPRPPSADRSNGTVNSSFARPGSAERSNNSTLGVPDPFGGRRSRPPSADGTIRGALRPYHLPTMEAVSPPSHASPS